jgi:hypothetical protein
MVAYLTRVELYGDDQAPGDYTRLHEEMEKRKFHRTIVADNGQRVHLPTAEYHSYGELSAAEVEALAVQACNAIGYVTWPGTAGRITRLCAVLVTQASAFKWIGLRSA